MNALGSKVKEYVEIPGGGHFLQFENVNVQFSRQSRTSWNLTNRHDNRKRSAGGTS
jgi:hypothetical protein